MFDQLPINNEKEKLSFLQKLHKITIVEKLVNPVGFILLLLASLFFTMVVVKMGFVMGVLFLIAVVAIPLVYGIVAHPKFGIIVLLTGAYFIMFLIRVVSTTFPLGTLMDALEGLLILGFFIKQKQYKDYSIFKGPISYMILIWVAYNMLEVANPSAESRLAWVYTVRTVAFVMLMYFVFMYNINSIKYLRVLIIMWLVYTVIGATYGIWQEVFGYSKIEQASMDADPDRAALYFIDGHWRKFSIFNDPVVFAYNMVLSFLLCVGLVWGPTRPWKKFLLVGLALICFVSMLFSGTRGAFALIPVGMILFCILNFNKKIMVLGIIGAVGFIVLIFMPTSNPNIHRFQTAFKPSNDASYLLRQQNQARIKPFIHTHPMGGGLGSVGVWGQKFSPNSMLAHFPPDSGYVRVAVEMGWIGIILFCILMYTILRTGIINFYKIKNGELKAYCLAMTIMIFAINVGNYPQEALVQFPTNIYFYLMVAILNKCLDLDNQLQLEAGQTTPLKQALVA
ncbi:O-antigen ligase family protein [Mucilaginibacter boryungensis]|uniref:O-antigen ligase family protein n=1 Tax=Mucilaginibacter boryungensis TaxID=768480 RepID=A0ABR9XC00_9SPHI|nr:O-antigen ligase family protein [Mucilaginibacter boryungensis]MBE9664893.1 O-antigen ligase family protein [Mucilaginibacter boryungensis]